MRARPPMMPPTSVPVLLDEDGDGAGIAVAEEVAGLDDEESVEEDVEEDGDVVDDGNADGSEDGAAVVETEDVDMVVVVSSRWSTWAWKPQAM